jgi:hypothetical protein
LALTFEHLPIHTIICCVPYFVLRFKDLGVNTNIVGRIEFLHHAVVINIGFQIIYSFQTVVLRQLQLVIILDVYIEVQAQSFVDVQVDILQLLALVFVIDVGYWVVSVLIVET